MKISILILVTAFLINCGGTSNKIRTQINTNGREFIINSDTFLIDLTPYVKPDITISPTHAIKFGDKYYCFFTDQKDSYNKYFFVIKIDGIIDNVIKLPRDLTECYYLDLFVYRDTIFSKPYMNDKSFYLDLKEMIWKETKEPDDIIYEDNQYYVTYLNFGEFGSTTWFKNKLSGKEYELASSGDIIYKVDSTFYIISGIKVLKIDDPLKMKPCDSNYYYQKVKTSKKHHSGSNSLLGAVPVFQDSTYSYWESKEPKLVISTSFKIGKSLFYLCTDSAVTFIAKLENQKMVPVQNLDKRYSVYDWLYSYRCKIQKDNFQLLKFDTKQKDKFGFIEIDNNKINIRYIKLQR